MARLSPNPRLAGCPEAAAMVLPPIEEFRGPLRDCMTRILSDLIRMRRFVSVHSQDLLVPPATTQSAAREPYGFILQCQVA